MKKVRLTLKPHQTLIYAFLYDAETGDLMLSAEVNYVIKAICERGYVVVP